MKTLIHIILLIGIVIFLQNCSDDYEKAQKLASAGNYQAFYSEISTEVKKGNNKAKNLLIDYFFKSIQDGDLEQVHYYLQQQSDLINAIDTDGNRAIDVVLFDEKINIPMLQLLLQYHPDLNYIVKYYDMTPLQVIVSGKYKNVEALKLLLQYGADTNFVGNSNRSKNTPLILSYVTDKIEVFSILLNNKAKFILPNNNIYDKIAASYGLYLKNNGVELQNFYSQSLSRLTRSLLYSAGYKILHEKNMKYIKLMQKMDKKPLQNSCNMTHLIKWYIKTQENRTLRILLKGKVCNTIIQEMKQFAIKQNNRPAMYILDQNKGERK